MYALTRALADLDTDVLEAIANLWDIELDPAEESREAVERLAQGMARAESVQAVWARLSDGERAALGTLQANEGRLPVGQFMRRFGEFRPMGPARREREKPWLEPANATEGLYYRGMVGRAFDEGPSGAQEYVFVPREVLALLPTPTEGLAQGAPGYALEAVSPEGMLPASHSAPDDLTTLLAYIRLRKINASQELASPQTQARLRRHLTHDDPAYAELLLQLAFGVELLADDEEGVTRPVAGSAKPWLEAPRTHQLRSLAEAWRDSPAWNDLAHAPGLQAGEWPNDPLAGRQAVLDALRRVPPGTWWSVESLVAALKAENPDFQRPAGDYDSWYIHDAESGEVLHGFDNWERIEGGLVRWLVGGPLRWLGLADVHPGVEGGALRLTALGAALLDLEAWPSEADPEAYLTVDEQSLISVPLAVSRYDRYIVARIAGWRDVPSPGADAQVYTYQLSPRSLEQAAEQGITVAHVTSLLKRTSAAPVPPPVERALAAWEEEGAQVVLHDVVVLVAKDFGVVEQLRNEPKVKRWLGQPLGPNAFAVARRDVRALAAALRRLGMLPMLEGFPEDDSP